MRLSLFLLFTIKDNTRKLSVFLLQPHEKARIEDGASKNETAFGIQPDDIYFKPKWEGHLTVKSELPGKEKKRKKEEQKENKKGYKSRLFYKNWRGVFFGSGYLATTQKNIQKSFKPMCSTM